MTTPAGGSAAPAVRLDPSHELAASARACRALQDARRLAEWTGERRITKAGHLLLRDARQAVQELRLPGDQGPGRQKARSARDFPELDRLWSWAVDAELIDTLPGEAHPGPALDALDDDEDDDVVEVWADLLSVELDGAFWSPALAQTLVPIVMRLYVDQHPLTVDDLLADTTQDLVRITAPAVHDLLRRLHDLDAAQLHGDDRVSLTPLGRFGVNHWLDTVGVHAPGVTDLAEASATDMLELGGDFEEPEQMDALVDDWIKARGDLRAAADLIAMAQDGNRDDRSTACALLTRLGDDAAPAVRRALDEPSLRPYVVTWLRDRGLDGPDPTARDEHWMFVDAIVSLGALGEQQAGAMIGELAALTPISEQLALITELWRCGHPGTVVALDLLGRMHPDRAVAKEARKSAMRARSRPAAAVESDTPSKTAPAESKQAKGKNAKGKNAKGKGSQSTYQLKVTLHDVRPPVWRRVQVPGSITLSGLHAVIQTAMGWSDSHLHEFEVDGVRYGQPDPDWNMGDVRSEARVKLAEVVVAGDRLRYTYDFGDDWRHNIVVEEVLSTEPSVALPRCVGGRRGCPPEDVGGPWGYAGFLEVYGDPAHPEHAELREWAGPYFAPAEFDADEVTRLLVQYHR